MAVHVAADFGAQARIIVHDQQILFQGCFFSHVIRPLDTTLANTSK